MADAHPAPSKTLHNDDDAVVQANGPAAEVDLKTAQAERVSAAIAGSHKGGEAGTDVRAESRNEEKRAVLHAEGGENEGNLTGVDSMDGDGDVAAMNEEKRKTKRISRPETGAGGGNWPDDPMGMYGERPAWLKDQENIKTHADWVKAALSGR